MKDINYALMLIKAHKFEGARDALEELLQSDPGNQDILYNLGMCYTELDEPLKGVDSWMLFDNSADLPHLIADEESGNLTVIDDKLFSMIERSSR